MLKTALITGATGDIGREIAKTLSKKGFELLLCGNKGEFDAQIKGAQLRFDVSDAKQVKKAFENIGKIDLLVCCAGISEEEKLLIDTSDEDINKLVATNLLGTIYTIKYALPHINRGGVIVNISSFLARNGCSCEAVYSATKGAIVSLTKSLAKECSAFGIRVNSISPGYIDTKMNSEFSQEEKNALIDKTPVGRFGKPSDVADGVAFLYENTFINGEDITISGGLEI